MISRNDNNKTIVTVPENIKDIKDSYGFIHSHMYKHKQGKSNLFILLDFKKTICNLRNKVSKNYLNKSFKKKYFEFIFKFKLNKIISTN